MSNATSSAGHRRRTLSTTAQRDSRNHLRHCRTGMAALEVVMTTVITMLIFSFATYWTMRLSRIVFSVIGEMVGSPLM